jgi:hypothetical protein
LNNNSTQLYYQREKMAPGVTYASDDPNLPTQEELTIFIGDLHHLITVGNKDSMETHWPIHNNL